MKERKFYVLSGNVKNKLNFCNEIHETDLDFADLLEKNDYPSFLYITYTLNEQQLKINSSFYDLGAKLSYTLSVDLQFGIFLPSSSDFNDNKIFLLVIKSIIKYEDLNAIQNLLNSNLESDHKMFILVCAIRSKEYKTIYFVLNNISKMNLSYKNENKYILQIAYEVGPEFFDLLYEHKKFSLSDKISALNYMLKDEIDIVSCLILTTLIKTYPYIDINLSFKLLKNIINKHASSQISKVLIDKLVNYNNFLCVSNVLNQLLFIAIDLNLKEVIIPFLLSQGADLNYKFYDENALFELLKNKKFEEFYYLIEKYLSKITTQTLNECLFYAASLSIPIYYPSLGSDVFHNYYLSPALYFNTYLFNNSLNHIFFSNDNSLEDMLFNIIISLIKVGANANYIQDGMSILDVLVKNKKQSFIIKLLLSDHFSKDIKIKAILFAVETDFMSVVDVAIEKDLINFHDLGFDNLLISAIKNNNFDLIKKVTEREECNAEIICAVLKKIKNSMPHVSKKYEKFLSSYLITKKEGMKTRRANKFKK